MASMAGFASLLLYKIFSMQRQSLKKPLINGILIGLFITSSSLSILMFVGYSALGLENRTPLFEETMPRRYFPSDSEMDLLKFLRNNLNIKNDDNVAIPENESKVYRGLSSKLEGFVGLPLPKIFQSPLTLQESCIEGFYITITKFFV